MKIEVYSLSKSVDAMRCSLLFLIIALGFTRPTAAQTTPTTRFADPVVHFGNVQGTTASVDELTARPELVITVAGKETVNSLQVISFTVSVLHAGIYEPLVVRAANMPVADTMIVEDPLTGQTRTIVSQSVDKEPGYTVQGNRLLPRQVDRLKTLKPGDKVFVDDIIAVSPDGIPRGLGSMMILVR